MPNVDQPPASVGRVFVAFAAISLVVVVAMGLALSRSFSAGSEQRGLAEGRAQVELMATASIEPLLGGQPVSPDLDVSTLAQLRAVTARLEASHRVLRLRVHSPDGRVVFADDGSGFTGPIDDEVLEAVNGHPVVHLTRINTDSNDAGPAGEAAIEAYQALGDPTDRLGVLEVYLPYAPIAAEIEGGLDRLYRLLALGLSALYLVLLGLALTTTRSPAPARTPQRLPGRVRPAHRPAQPAPVPARAGADHPRQRSPGCGRGHRPGPVQGRQRLPRPPQRGRPAHGPRPAAGRRRATRGRRGPARGRRVRHRAARRQRRGRRPGAVRPAPPAPR